MYKNLRGGRIPLLTLLVSQHIHRQKCCAGVHWPQAQQKGSSQVVPLNCALLCLPLSRELGSLENLCRSLWLSCSKFQDHRLLSFCEVPVAKGDRTTRACPGAREGQFALNSLGRCRGLNGGEVVLKVAGGGLPSGRHLDILGQGHQEA